MDSISLSYVSQRTRAESYDANSKLGLSESSRESPQIVEAEAGRASSGSARFQPPREQERRHLRIWKQQALRYPRMAKVVKYLRGPRPKIDLPDPKPYLDREYHFKTISFSIRIESIFTKLTHPVTRPWVFVLLAVAYIVGLAFLSRQQSFLTPADAFASCTGTLWGKDASCGLDGQSCLPFDNATYDVRCPAQCRSVELANPRTVGNEQVVYKPLVVGGGDSEGTYRGDSFVCAAALHAGVIDNNRGGCFSIQLIGNYTSFLSSAAHGITSLGFPSVFPLSFRFLSSTPLSHCKDLRDGALAFNSIITALLFLLRPKPIVLFYCLVCIGFWHISLFSQPRTLPPSISTAFGDFLPSLFVCYAFWRLAYRFVLPTFLAHAPLESMLLYLFPFWVGVLNNMTFDRLPIDRLILSDVSKRPGGLASLIIIIVVVVIAAINQARVIRKTGWLPYYVGWYIAGGLVALVLALLPSLELRVHHYIIAMALIPGTAFPTRVSAIAQGLLLGLFLNGVAAWGYDSILETSAELRRDAAIGSGLPTFVTNSSNFNVTLPLRNQTLQWNSPTEGWDGFSLLVDDVERYYGEALSFSLAGLQEGIPHFFRLAYTKTGSIYDFTKPATLWPNGSWTDPLPGPS